MAGYSPLPWVWDSSKDELYSSVSNLVIARFLEDADAAFIAQACNAHDDLLAACEAAREFVRDISPDGHPEDLSEADFSQMADMLDAAIAKARGEEATP